MQVKQPMNYEEATGRVPYKMTNNYLFIAVLQEDKYALKGLVAALLHMDADEIKSIEIENPIMLGADINLKEFVLDIKLKFNDNSTMNLEMQVLDYGNWVPRSISYLCREWDRIKKGADYDEACNAYHIGFLDFTLFQERPKFYATYRLMDIADGYEYSDRFNLSVVELNNIAMASDEDRHYEIDKWARLFKAGTWEDIKMLAEDNKYIESAAKGMFFKTQDESILRLCRKMDEEIEGDKRRAERLTKLEEDIIKLETRYSGLQTEYSGLQTEYSGLQTEYNGLQTEYNGLQTEYNGLQTEYNGLQTECSGLQTKNSDLQTKNMNLEAENSELKENIARLQAELAKLKNGR